MLDCQARGHPDDPGECASEESSQDLGGPLLAPAARCTWRSSLQAGSWCRVSAQKRLEASPQWFRINKNRGAIGAENKGGIAAAIGYVVNIECCGFFPG